MQGGYERLKEQAIRIELLRKRGAICTKRSPASPWGIGHRTDYNALCRINRWFLPEEEDWENNSVRSGCSPCLVVGLWKMPCRRLQTLQLQKTDHSVLWLLEDARNLSVSAVHSLMNFCDIFDRPDDVTNVDTLKEMNDSIVGECILLFKEPDLNKRQTLLTANLLDLLTWRRMGSLC